ncbi:MAG: rhodanese-like domain-containing protein [Bacteroidetes bacterium]|nr:rhodanese-like domain-containing protein [Bacteroidota bacterium]
MAKINWISMLALVGLLYSCAQETEKQTTAVPEVVHELLEPADFASKISKSDDWHLIDLRTPDEYESGHLKGAVNINYFDPAFGDSLKQLDAGIPIFIYSQTSKRSTKALPAIKEAGFTVIYELKGGYEQMAL